jgi:hypothetical protein
MHRVIPSQVEPVGQRDCLLDNDLIDLGDLNLLP